MRANNSFVLGFNGSRTYPMSEINLTVEARPIKTNVAFLVLNTKSPYNKNLGKRLDPRNARCTLHISSKVEVHDQLRGIRNQG